MRSLLASFAAVGLLVGLVVLGVEAAALHFGDQRIVVYDASYEPLLAENGGPFTGAQFVDLSFEDGPWWQQLVLPWWGYPVIGAGVGAAAGLACGVAGLKISRPGRS